MKTFYSALFFCFLLSVAFAQHKEATTSPELPAASIEEPTETSSTDTNPIPAKEIVVEEKTKVKFKFGQGLRIYAPNDNFYLKMEGRIQALFQGDYDLSGGEDPFEATFMVRRMRLKFSGDLLKKRVEYKIELGFSNRDLQVKGKDTDYANIILDAWTRFKIIGGLKVRVGQFKLPGNRERVISSGDLQMVDRSMINKTFNIDRDAGVMLENKNTLNNAVFKQQFSISLGEGRNRLNSGTGFAYSGRAEFLPMGEFESKGDYVMSAIKREAKPKLAIGVDASFNDDALRAGGQNGSALYESRDITTLNADFMFKYLGLSVFGEYAQRWSDNPITQNEAADDFVYVYAGKGVNLQAGWMFKRNWEIAARYSVLLPDAIITDFTDKRMDYTLAVSKFIVGHKLKVQGDVTYSERMPAATPGTSNGQMQFRLTTNFNF